MTPFVVHHGDCLEVLPTLAADSIDSIVTDPPYGLGFMGKAWDHTVPGVPFWLEMLRVAKPGAYLAAFGGTRTFHRMACAIEDAGWELRDTLMWVYGSGFPKSHNGEWGGTALKPAWEPIILARKPLIGTVEANWRQHGTGALNIDGCRVEGPKGECTRGAGGQNGRYGPIGAQGFIADDGRGRWPANLVHDGSDEVLALFPGAPGQIAKASTSDTQRGGQNTYGVMARGSNGQEPRADTGSAARFFYCAKASKADRDEGLGGFSKSLPPSAMARVSQLNGEENTCISNTKNPRANVHPTVKPTELMRWLCRLVTPPGGLVLDPFTGSGSTGRGAIAEGLRFVGIEREAEYVAIAEARIAAAIVPPAAPSPQLDMLAVLDASVAP